tara:strand:- start:171 stop:464 length:294 start_codon:yes stop_codon:yes gene_type:complete
MATIEITREHSFTVDEARSRARRFIDEMQKKRPELFANIEWSDNGSYVEAKGKGFSAVVEVGRSEASIEVELNLMLKPFKKKLESKINDKFDEVFDD